MGVLVSIGTTILGMYLISMFFKLLELAENKTFNELCNIAVSLAKTGITTVWNHYQA